MKTGNRFAAIVLSIKVVVLLAVLLAGQLVNAQSVVPCSQLAAASTLAPEWVAVCQQYERSYQPVTTHNLQTAIARVAALPPFAPEWVAVRQQYERDYMPTCQD
jgi:hypothetical protein